MVKLLHPQTVGYVSAIMMAFALIVGEKVKDPNARIRAPDIPREWKNACGN